MSAAIVGQGIDRVDGRLKVTGTAPYAAEVAVANVTYAVIVTSTTTRGRVTAIDARAAERVAGVLRVLTHENAPKLPGIDRKEGMIDRVLQVLQDDRVFYADQPVALVVAETLEAAQEAATQVLVTYQPEAAVGELEALVDQAEAPPNAGRGPAETKRGDADAAMKTAAVRIDAVYTTPVENHNPMEMHSTIAVWQGDDRLTVYEATQGVFECRRKLSTMFGLPKDNVRVISRFVGGGFGCKGATWSPAVLAAMAARVTGRAVKLMVTRPQMFSLVGHRPKTIQHLSLGAGADGRLVAIAHDVISETSRFDLFVEPSAAQTSMLYACPSCATRQRIVRIDIPTPTFQRAPGESTGTFALESAMDELAVALKMDPIALRLANYAETDPGEKRPWSSKSLRECYRRGAERFGWARRTPAPRSMRDGRSLVGWGMATATYPANQAPSSAIARLRADGSALVQAGTQDIGTGTYTIMAQIAADALAMPIERVMFDLGDTAMPETPVSGGSQTASSTGSAVKRACLALRDQLVARALADPASPLSGLATGDVEAVDGVLRSKKDHGKQDPYARVVAGSGQPELTATFDNKPKEDRKRFSTHSFGAQFVEVKVDEDLAEVRVTRVVSAFAAGKILNAKTARSQFLGGIVWGIGMALHEHTVRDPRTARVATRDLADYHVPVNLDVPSIEIISIDEDDPHVNEIGAKGIGEIGITGMAAAIANAVHHATGKRVRDLPITPDKVL
ncbi:MAG TPA: xanthine dehydrogenase family protein molybdopterin-binding subunit [Polyangiaceae bacterium]|nr:xanthine dehydrogenase family protein molybdopterin-binding subunit [Polyangiaceae bacterium]